MSCCRIVVFGVIALLALSAAAPVHAAIFVTLPDSVSQENSNPVSGSAEITIVGNVLTLVLTNTTAGGTKAQGDALTGIVVDLSVPLPSSFALSTMALTSGSTVQTSKTVTNAAAPISGSWTSKLTSTAYDFGVATTGVDLFQGSSITRGNASPNYGIISAETFGPTYTTTFGGSKFPFIKDSLTFTFSGATGLTESNISNVKLIFGTAAPGLIDTEPEDTPVIDSAPAPEPGTLAIFATLFAGLGCLTRFQRRD